MPLIRVEFDNNIVTDEDARALSVTICEIVSKETGIKDVFVYANSAHIKIQIAPIEIFIEMTSAKIQDQNDLVRRIKTSLLSWKKKTNFPHLINMTLIPMTWIVETDI